MSNNLKTRRENRFEIATVAAVKVTQSGCILRTTTSNISGCGVLVNFKEPTGLRVGDEVSCEWDLPKGTDSSLPVWTLGRVVRVGDRTAAIDFSAGAFPYESTMPGEESQ